MRAVLRTLAQCHHHRILHRDVKPGNFMLLGEAEDTPVKAIDFGLACFFDPKALPLRHLGLEGTPHFMAPENLSSEVWPASDVWAAGVMTYQLLSGRMPFDDWKNPRNPALSQLWKSILTEEPKFSGQAWAEVSEGAKDFIRKLLTR
ncbi:kinase-like domain-containing protein [Haematococcus lacustris]